MRLLLPVLTLICIAGCSKIQLAVDWADTVIMWEVDDYFDLKGSKEKEVRSAVKAKVEEIRKNDLPALAEKLDDLAARVANKQVKIDFWIQFQDSTQKVFQQAFRRFRDVGRMLIDAERKGDFKRFDEKFQSKIKDDKDDLSTESKRLKVFRKLVNKIVDQTVGYLTEGQWKSLEAVYLKIGSRVADERLQSRLATFEKFKVVRSDLVKTEQFLDELFGDWESQQSQSLKLARREYRDKLNQWIVELAQNLESKQEKNLITNLERISRDLKKSAIKK